MADEDIEPVMDEKRWKHPRRIVGAAFLMGTALGASVAMSKNQKPHKSFWQKMLQ